ncbi:MAG: VOC family protein, partial [Actinomycetota bacterium]
MSLSNYRVCPGAEVTFVNVDVSVAVSDMIHSRSFYEEKLGFTGVEERADGSCVYSCGGGSSLRVYASPARAEKAATTLATWYVADIEQVVDELSSKGVTFERYAEPSLKTDEKGIHELADGKIAWFKDPDG